MDYLIFLKWLKSSVNLDLTIFKKLSNLDSVNYSDIHLFLYPPAPRTRGVTPPRAGWGNAIKLRNRKLT